MDFLLDTHILLWWDGGAAELAPAVRTAIGDPSNRVFVSAASIWEIAIKSGKGKLTFKGRPSDAIARNSFLALPIDPRHVEEAGSLKWTHPDPFDRMLVAQARLEGLTLLHADEAISGFREVAQLWAR